MGKIRLTMGLLDEDMKQISPIKQAMPRSENLKANSSVELSQTAPVQKLSTPQTFKTWDEYTETELINLREHENSIYISLYLQKYGFSPQDMKVNSSVELKQTAPKLKLSTPETFKTLDEYTETELIHLRKHEKAIYISLYMLKYGFPPQNM